MESAKSDRLAPAPRWLSCFDLSITLVSTSNEEQKARITQTLPAPRFYLDEATSKMI